MKKHTPKNLPLFTIPRIIGVLLAIISITLYLSSQDQWFALALAGAILLFAPRKHAKTRFDKLTDSFTHWKTILITGVYDIVYWLAVFMGAYFLQARVQAKSLTMPSNLLTREALLNPETANVAGPLVKQFYTFLLGIFAVYLAFIFIAYCLTRALIWSTLAKKKFTKQFLLRFSGLNAAYWGIWLIPAVLLIFIAGNAGTGKELLMRSAFMLIGAGFGYFAVIVHTLYMKTHKIGHSLSHGIAWGIARLHLLVVPYTYIFLAYLIFYQAIRLLQNTAIIQPISALFVVLFIAWVRTYLYTIIKEFK